MVEGPKIFASARDAYRAGLAQSGAVTKVVHNGEEVIARGARQEFMLKVGQAGGLRKYVKGYAMKPFKAAGWATAIVGGLGALAYFAHKTSNARRFSEADARAADEAMAENALPPVVTPQELLAQAQQPNTMMGEAPVEGRFAGRVKDERSGVTTQLGATPPNMSVVPESSVQDLGAATPAR